MTSLENHNAAQADHLNKWAKKQLQKPLRSCDLILRLHVDAGGVAHACPPVLQQTLAFEEMADPCA